MSSMWVLLKNWYLLVYTCVLLILCSTGLLISLRGLSTCCPTRCLSTLRSTASVDRFFEDEFFDTDDEEEEDDLKPLMVPEWDRERVLCWSCLNVKTITVTAAFQEVARTNGSLQLLCKRPCTVLWRMVDHHFTGVTLTHSPGQSSVHYQHVAAS